MEVFLLIVVNVILPVFLLIGAGVFLHRTFKFDMNTLSKLNAYFLMPAVSFANMYQSKLEGGVLADILLFLLLQSALLVILSTGVAKLAKFDKGLSSSFKNSVVLINSGNFGLPVSQLVFQGNPLGASIQVVVMIYQNLLTNTYGLMNAVAVNSPGWKALKELAKNPVFYAVILGWTLHSLDIKLPSFMWTPVQNVSEAFLAIALVTLGAQSAYLRLTRINLSLALSLACRLLMAPAVALLIIFALGIKGTTAQALFIASSFPTSRNSAVFALEYDNHPEYAAQVVLVSTIFSSVTVAVVVYLAKIWF
ncbi:AEC family transporter [Paenibacillus hamazuiensis]|uniref:AEC family transporter n=1 Tax=Paenibacillus hamazuiensis TaxID=2936508 RepID=UPI00200E398B|nr:AEC family transporter [Paenibacillus hamazuiensis]